MSVPQVAIDAVNHYLSKGITKDVAVGIVAVLYAGESSLNPGSQGTQASETGGVLNPSGAYGIASWNGPRQAALQAFANAKGEAVSALNTQLDFVLTESANSYPAVWAAIQQAGMTYQNFIPIFVEKYEDPADPSAEITRSLAFAQTLYPVIQPMAPVVTTPAAPAAPTTTTSTSTMDPAVLAIIESIISAVISGLLRELLTDAVPAAAAPAAPVATAAPAIDIGSIATAVSGLLLPQIGPILSTIVQTELAKIIPPAAAPKA